MSLRPQGLTRCRSAVGLAGELRYESSEDGATKTVGLRKNCKRHESRCSISCPEAAHKPQVLEEAG